ncbi:hypothetical protein SCP_0904620 [Sparassis crispa]|uniref:Uncharacterized protein n=1 Tax=Sparassis crispa TaxID=139825 RepID=A0A401GWM7_9APHY|nr:hypothetical protein SCP_0904620 [Sparassis crispa]GBE86583.1 hypothetical protein SCP_0904620 [Sparassis crispa]
MWRSVTRLDMHVKGAKSKFLLQLYTAIWPSGGSPAPHNSKIFATDSVLVPASGYISPWDLDEGPDDIAASATDTFNSEDEDMGISDESMSEDVTTNTEEDGQAEEHSTQTISFQRKTLDFTRLSHYNSFAMVPPRLLVRSEYEELAALAETLDRHTVLTGQPGVRKSYALYYLLARRLSCGLPTIFAKADNQWYFFCDLGVYLLNATNLDYLLDDFAQIHASEPVDTNKILHQSTIILIDSRDGEPFPRISVPAEWIYIVASSPNRKRYKHWVKQNTAAFWVMRTWSWSEIYAARDMRRPKRVIDVNELRVTFTKFSHTAWVVYLTHTRGQERAIAYALGSLSPHLLASLIRQDHSVEADIYSQLVEVNP